MQHWNLKFDTLKLKFCIVYIIIIYIIYIILLLFTYTTDFMSTPHLSFPDYVTGPSPSIGT